MEIACYNPNQYRRRDEMERRKQSISFLRGWYVSCMRYAGASDQGLIDTLLRRLMDEYSQPQRHYHGVPHILSGVRIMQQLSFLSNDISIDVLAYLYHDIVCIPGAKDNEDRSAEWAERDFAIC